jgi:hypothetical protein
LSDHNNTTKDGEHEQSESSDLHAQSGLSTGHESDAHEGSHQELSPEKVDAILKEKDPDFIKSLEQIHHGDPHEYSDEKFDPGFTLEDEKNIWQQKKWFKRTLARFISIIPKTTYKYKAAKVYIPFIKRKLRTNTIYFFTHLKPIILNHSQRLLIKIKDAVNAVVTEIKSYSRNKKIGLAVFVLVAGFSINLVYKVLSHKIFKVQKELFLLSMDEWAQEKYFYGPNDHVEAFYDSTRMVQNILNLKKIWVNIRPSANSGPNPMAALEFYIEGTIAEVVIEIKDRESEVGDLFLRTVEDLTYDELASGEGKKNLCDRLGKEVNNLLTKGKVRHVYIKTAIIKP